MTKKKSKKAVPFSDTLDLVKAADNFHMILERFKSEHPNADVEAILSEHGDLLPTLRLLQNRELDRFVDYAKEQGTKMSFSDMELGVLAAGRKDMQNGLSEIVDSLKFEKPVCPECGDKEDNRGRSKKN